MAFDDIISAVGGFGRHQTRVYLLLCAPALICAFHTMGSVFLQAKGKSRCLLPNENYQNASYDLPEETWDSSFPWDNKTQEYSSCTYYDESGETVTCEYFVFNKQYMKNTVTIKWELVCSQSWKSSTADSLYMVGTMAGSLIYGHISDRFGRKNMYLVSLTLMFIIGTATIFSPNYYFYAAARFFMGLNTIGAYIISFVIGIEMVGPEERFIAGTGTHFFFCLGYLLIALLAYLIRDWRMLQLAFTVPTFLLVFTWWFVPESVRWLVTKNQLKSAKKILLQVAVVNKVPISEEEIEDMLIQELRSSSIASAGTVNFFKIFKYPKLFRRTLIIFFIWMANGLTYYAISLNAENLNENIFLSFFITGIAELPGYIFMIFTINRFGRKFVICSSLLLAGTMLLVEVAVPKNVYWLTIVLTFIGKMAITASYASIFMCSTELFPTVIRNSSLAAGSISSRLGSILAPQVNLLGEYTFKSAPMVICGSISLSAGLLAMFLPETMGKKLPDAMLEAEHFGEVLREEPERNR